MTIDLKSPMLLGFYQGNTHSERFGKDIPASYCVSNQDIPNDARAQDLQTFNRFCHQLSHGMPDLAISSANNEIKSVQINQNRRNFSTNRKEDDSEIENDLFRYKTRIRFRDRPVQCKITSPFHSSAEHPHFVPCHATILVRRKSFDSCLRGSICGSLPSPVVITLPLLDALRGLSLPHAARVVGVSATAFKKACRRLGVRRWDYRRGPGRAGSRRARSAPRAGTATRDAEGDRGDRCSPARGRSAEDADGGPETARYLTDSDPAMGDSDPAGSERGTERADALLLWGWPDGADSDGAAADDALVLEMLARPW